MRRSRYDSLAARTVWFGIYSLALILGNLFALRALVVFSRSDSAASHHLLIPFVTLALLYRSRGHIFAAVRFDWRWGLGVIGLGVGCLLAGARDSLVGGGALTWFVGAFVILWVGGFLLFYGRSAARAAAFPLLFLTFMIPVPAPVLDGAIQLLKLGSANVVASLFFLSGMPYHREGFVFTLPTIVIEVADACSGIRSSIALALSAMLAGHLYLHGLWKKILLILAVLPITIFKNGIRIVGLSWLATNVNPGFLEGPLHTDGGVLFFAMALGLLASVLWLLRRSASLPRVAQREPSPYL